MNWVPHPTVKIAVIFWLVPKHTDRSGGGIGFEQPALSGGRFRRFRIR